MRSSESGLGPKEGFGDGLYKSFLQFAGKCEETESGRQFSFLYCTWMKYTHQSVLQTLSANQQQSGSLELIKFHFPHLVFRLSQVIGQ